MFTRLLGGFSILGVNPPIPPSKAPGHSRDSDCCGGRTHIVNRSANRQPQRFTKQADISATTGLVLAKDLAAEERHCD